MFQSLSYPGIGGTPYNNYLTQPKPIYDPTLPNGDRLQKVNGQTSALQYRMNPNSRDVLFDANEDVFYIITSDASGTNTVQAYSFTPVKQVDPKTEQYVTMEEFNKFKEEVMNGQQLVWTKSVPASSTNTATVD